MVAEDSFISYAHIIDKELAVEKFRQWLKTGWFTPKDLSAEAEVKVSPVVLPFIMPRSVIKVAWSARIGTVEKSRYQNALRDYERDKKIYERSIGYPQPIKPDIDDYSNWVVRSGELEDSLSLEPSPAFEWDELMTGNFYLATNHNPTFKAIEKGLREIINKKFFAVHTDAEAAVDDSQFFKCNERKVQNIISEFNAEIEKFARKAAWDKARSLGDFVSDLEYQIDNDSSSQNIFWVGVPFYICQYKYNQSGYNCLIEAVTGGIVGLKPKNKGLILLISIISVALTGIGAYYLTTEWPNIQNLIRPH